MSTRPQSQRNSNEMRGADARAVRGTAAKNKDRLKADRQKNMAGKPAANKDQFGSRHNEDAVKKEQRRGGSPAKGHQDFAFRESAQETRKATGERNRQPGNRKRK